MAYILRVSWNKHALLTGYVKENYIMNAMPALFDSIIRRDIEVTDEAILKVSVNK